MKKTGVKSDYKGGNNSLRLFVHMVDWVLADDCEEVEKELSLSTKPKDFRINGGRDDLEESLGFLQVLQGSHASGLPSGPRQPGLQPASTSPRQQGAQGFQTQSYVAGHSHG